MHEISHFNPFTTVCNIGMDRNNYSFWVIKVQIWKGLTKVNQSLSEEEGAFEHFSPFHNFYATQMWVEEGGGVHFILEYSNPPCVQISFSNEFWRGVLFILGYLASPQFYWGILSILGYFEPRGSKYPRKFWTPGFTFLGVENILLHRVGLGLGLGLGCRLEIRISLGWSISLVISYRSFPEDFIKIRSVELELLNFPQDRDGDGTGRDTLWLYS